MRRSSPDADRIDRLRDAFWARHANPWSGATRVAASPALIYAVYRRDVRLLAAVVLFVTFNPVVFPPPKRTDRWFTRAVLAEREWIETGRGTVGVAYPNVLNALNVPVTLYTLVAAVRRRPLRAAVGTAATMGLKLLWVDEIVRRTGVGGDERVR